jgi:TolB protein
VSRDGRYRSYVLAATDATPGSAANRLVVESREGAARHDIPVFGTAAFNFDPAGDAMAFIAAEQPNEVASLPVGPLRIVDPSSGAVRTLLDGFVVAFFWAPDGRTIASLRLGPGGIEARRPEGTRIAIAGQPGPPAVEAVQADGGVTLDLVFTDAATGTARSERAVVVSQLFVTQLLPFFDQYALSHRLWAPDSAALVLPLVEGGETGLYVIRADGSEPALLAVAEMGFWSP